MTEIVAPTAKPPTETSTALASQPHAVIITRMLWNMRNRLDNFAMIIPDEDVEQFNKSLEYNEQKPKLIIEARAGFTVVRMADATTGNAIIQSESDERALDRKEAAQKVRNAAQQTRGMLDQVRADVAANTISNSTILDLCDLAGTLAKELVN